jgi:hypothetical protein
MPAFDDINMSGSCLRFLPITPMPITIPGADFFDRLRCYHKFGDGSSRVKNWKRMFCINNQKQIVVNAGVFYVFGSLK